MARGAWVKAICSAGMMASAFAGDGSTNMDPLGLFDGQLDGPADAASYDPTELEAMQREIDKRREASGSQ